MKILVIDNYDSFVYNLVYLIERLKPGVEIRTVRNDQISLEDVAAYDKILLSPGPGIPEEAGIMPGLIKRYGSSKSILGVCLGHQAIAEAYGGKLENMSEVLHGVQHEIQLKDHGGVFKGVDEKIAVCRYHSWTVVPHELPDCLQITAIDHVGRIMAIRHKDYDLQGVQFHPESILTPMGAKIIANWIETVDKNELAKHQSEILLQVQ
ncbi:MAG: aminodeoxychorismate/anthranilate synthase component II [Cyclobacteriaceae bacterium]|nr:aminodeoxychorismate/anthranilate synthase component II [Cyclobacteriaceae bacterium]MCH8516968.1 aminodeoxychorismate/anthranilate synthase component II [Cyclobacteriaceae bacterium]